MGFVLGGLLLWWSAGLHLHLWLSDGYRHVATIGPLFLLQSVAGGVLGGLVIAVRRLWVAVLGTGFAFSTVLGLVISVQVGLFGFRDSWVAAFARESLVIEIGAVVVLVLAGGICLVSTGAAASPVVPTGATDPRQSDNPSVPNS